MHIIRKSLNAADKLGILDAIYNHVLAHDIITTLVNTLNQLYSLVANGNIGQCQKQVFEKLKYNMAAVWLGRNNELFSAECSLVKNTRVQ